MDGGNFDDLVRQLASQRSRRSILRGLVAGGMTIVAGKTGESLAAPAPKVDVCHWDQDAGVYVWISISQNGWESGHQRHHELDYLRGGGCCTAAECGADDACTSYSCNDGACAETNYAQDCVYSGWSEWSACSVECGGGIQERTRQIVSEGTCGGAACDANALYESQACNTDPCGCVPVPTSCQYGQCGPLTDNCGNYLGECGLGYGQTCVPGVSTCCSEYPCYTWGDCPVPGTYCC